MRSTRARVAWTLALAPALQQSSAPPVEADVRALDAHGLRTIFLDLLGRPPLTTEREGWLGRPADELLDELISAPEVWRNWLEEQLYYFLLVDNFRPVSEGILSIPARMAEGRIAITEVLNQIAISTSFDRRNPGPDTFVTVVMEQLLGLTVQRNARELEIGKKIYDGTPGTFLGQTGNSQADVVRIALADERMTRHLLRREYERLVRQEPAERELSAWCATLAADGTALPRILRGWIESDAYTRRLEKRAAMPNRLFVRALFVDVFDRLPEEEEAQRMRNALDGLADAGPLRSVIARIVIDSRKARLPERAELEDPEAWIAGLFVRLLGRRASDAELAAFVEAYRDPACKPATVLYAIVSHPEYQTW